MTVGHVTLVQGLIFGPKTAVLTFVFEALIKVSKRALKNGLMVVVAIAAFVASAFVKLPFPLVISAAASIGAMMYFVEGKNGRNAHATAEAEIAYAMPEWTKPSARRLFSTLGIWLAIWFAPLVVLWQLLGPSYILTAEATFFSRMEAVMFGGAYAVLAYVAQ